MKMATEKFAEPFENLQRAHGQVSSAEATHYLCEFI
jgi:hypothetical protein